MVEKAEKPTSPGSKERFTPTPEREKKKKPPQEKPEHPSQPEKRVTEKEVTPEKEEAKTPAEQVGDILSRGLGDIFEGMSSKQQEKFLEAGRKVNTQVQEWIEKNKVSEDKVLRAVRRWLSTVDSRNKAFFEQEAKKKTEDILKVLKDYIH